MTVMIQSKVEKRPQRTCCLPRQAVSSFARVERVTFQKLQFYSYEYISPTFTVAK